MSRTNETTVTCVRGMHGLQLGAFSSVEFVRYASGRGSTVTMMAQPSSSSRKLRNNTKKCNHRGVFPSAGRTRNFRGAAAFMSPSSPEVPYSGTPLPRKLKNCFTILLCLTVHFPRLWWFEGIIIITGATTTGNVSREECTDDMRHM